MDPVLYELFNSVFTRPKINKTNLAKLLKAAEITLVEYKYGRDTFLMFDSKEYKLHIPLKMKPYDRLYCYLYAYLLKKYASFPFISINLKKLKLNESIKNKIKEELFYGLEKYSFEDIISTITSELASDFINTNNRYSFRSLTKESMQILEENITIFNILCKNYVNPEQLFR